MDLIEMIEKARTGDQEAFVSLYSEYKTSLYRYAYYRLGNPQDAEDAVSECVLSAWKQIRDLKSPDAFSVWLFRILGGACAARIREQVRRRQMASLDAGEGAGGGSSDGELPGDRGIPGQSGFVPGGDPAETLSLMDALASLAEDEREIVLLASVTGFTSAEIAGHVGLTPGSVRSKLSRSLAKLRRDREG